MIESTSLNKETANTEPLVLELFYRSASIVITAEQTPFHIGRDNIESGLSINCEFASRQHCAIEFNDGKFVLKDFSRNGTFVQLNRAQTFRVFNEITPLIGSGCFKLGATMGLDDPERILFRVKHSAKKMA
ncbi:MAG: FHA domain-containing protein [Gammaproteobacteria bacterium]|nr:MAG: FHA domain-containing protein [Gammaproteobacteria bacterium]